jgi:death-on-curing protein
MTWFPNPEDILAIHFELVEMFVDGADPIVPAGPRDGGLVASACSRPQTSLAGIEKYPSVEKKAAALLHSLIQNHPFHNGNKRTALVSAITFLLKNDRLIGPDTSDDEVFDIVTSIAAGRFPDGDKRYSPDEIVEAIGAWIRERTIARQRRPSSMRTNDFLASCEAAGVSVKESGSSFVLARGTQSLRIGQDTRELPGPVIKAYLKRLGLSERDSGIALDEFEAGVSPEQVEIRRFKRVLDRLAHA